jgi:hypothetical protein
MIRGFKLTLFGLFCFLAVGQLVGTGVYSQDQPAEKFFKNIKALRGLPASQIGALMDSYNKALGVSCDYCHVAGDMPNGTKPAHQASVRDITMTREINDKYKHVVDCMSCHQGKAKPPAGGGIVANNPPKGGPPDKLTFTASSGSVPFPHGTHMSMECSKCHHQGGNSACGTCHKHNAGDARLSFKMVSHSGTSNRACTGCHKQMSVGPQTCTTCHKQEGAQGGGTKPPPAPDKLTFTASSGSVPFPHGTHMSMECSKCHHQGGNVACSTCHKHNAGDARLSFKMVSHSATSNRACTGCHKQMSIGPQTCTTCHKQEGAQGGGTMGPAKLMFAASYGKVPFPHDTHMNMDCGKCHHTGGNSACGTCHKHNGGDAGFSFKKVGHSLTSNRACMGCHKQMSVGPQTCAACHKK